MKLTYNELLKFIQRWMILSDERMPKGKYDSFKEICPGFGMCGKIGIFLDIDVHGFDDLEAECVDNINDVISFLNRHEVEVIKA